MAWPFGFGRVFHEMGWAWGFEAGLAIAIHVCRDPVFEASGPGPRDSPRRRASLLARDKSSAQW